MTRRLLEMFQYSAFAIQAESVGTSVKVDRNGPAAPPPMSRSR